MNPRHAPSLLQAALLGIFASQTACGTSPDTGGTGGAETGGAGASEAGGSSSGGSDASGGAASATGGADATGGLGPGGVGGAIEGVTSSKIVADLSLDDFKVLCDEAGGTVEVHPSCGGVVSGRGFSYDSDIDTFTEHTCRGYNTCTGFSCVIE